MLVKRVLLIYFLMALMSSTYATSKFSIADLNLDMSRTIKAKNVTEHFLEKYKTEEANIYINSEENEKEWTNLSKKTTFLILGPSSKNESDYEYISRKQEYYKLRYAPNEIPKDSSGNYITSSQEYQDDVVSGLCIPQMFTKLNSLDIEYDSISSIKFAEVDGLINAKVLIKNITYNATDEENPRKILRKQNDIIFNYLYKWNGKEYKLYYYTAMLDEDLDKYFDEFKDAENKNKLSFKSKMLTKDIEGYDLTNLYSLSETTISEVYNNTKKSVLMLNAIYEKSSFYSANAFCIENDYFVTTWEFIEKALLKAQFINAVDNFGNAYEIEGIVYANAGLDLAIIKVKNTILEPIKMDKTVSISKNDPIIILSSKTGYTLSTDAGIFIKQNEYITNLLTLSEHDGGSPILDKNGNCIGMNTVQLINSDLSIALPIEKVLNIWEKLDIYDEKEVISFEKMKEQEFFINLSKEQSINIDNTIYQEYYKIGEMQETIPLDLVKIEKQNNIVSLRFKNNIKEYIDTFTLSSAFEIKLLEQGFKNELESELKRVYENNKYQIALIKQFDYLIVIIVGK